MATAVKADGKVRLKQKPTLENVSENTATCPFWEVVVAFGAEIPDEEWAGVPDDSSINYKHYLYGAPKKSP